MNENLKGRLVNYKFSSAMSYLEGESEDTKELVKALSDTFSNVGLLSGAMNIIIYHAVHDLIKEEF